MTDTQNAGSQFRTTDLNLATYIWRQKKTKRAFPPAQLLPARNGQNPRVEFVFESVPPGVLDDWRRDKDGFKEWETARRQLLAMIAALKGGK